MTNASASPLVRYIRQLAAAPPTVGLPDHVLLDRFLRLRDEVAFAVLAQRHGGLVLGVCRRVLGDRHDAEDAVQATLLVFARRAASIRRTDSLGPWLHGVACRVARKARAHAARRRACERLAAVPEAVQQPDDLVWRDLRPLLDAAVARLPEGYRVPFVLHYLQGATVTEVACQLGCPRGTVAARLARARAALRRRLAHWGLALSAGVLAALVSERAATAAAPQMVSAAKAAALAAAGKAVSPRLISPAAAALAQGGPVAMHMTTIKVGVLVLVVAGALGVAVWAGTHRTAAAEPAKEAPVAPVPRAEGPAPAVPKAPRQFRLRLRVFEGDPHGSREAGTLKVRAEPVLTVQEGRPFTFLDGGELAVPDGADKIQFVEFGRSLRGTVRPGAKTGTVFLDVTLDDTTIPDQKGEVLRLNSEGTRTLGTFKVGEVVKLHGPKGTAGRQVWAEFVADIVE
jgi:RNA polymerase sigma factor (sigma-70 family)